MKKLFLHVGYHKTGTSALQYFFWNNRATLKRFGFYYPKTGLEGYSHGKLANIIKPNNRDSRLKKTIAKFHKEVSSETVENIILSSEVFLEGWNISQATKNFLTSLKFDLKIIFYLRNQANWLESIYNEVIRDPIRRYTGNLYEMREYRDGYHDYTKMVDNWASVFGDNAIVLFEYGNDGDRNDIFYKILDYWGIKEHRGFHFSMGDKQLNVRFHPLVTEFLRRINRFGIMGDQYLKILEELYEISKTMHSEYGKEYYTNLEEEEIKILIDKYLQKNNILFRQYTGKEGVTLFDGYDEKRTALSVKKQLTPRFQHMIFDRLSVRSKRTLEQASVAIQKREPGKHFLNIPPRDAVMRLNEVIMRQRFELRKLYGLAK